MRYLALWGGLLLGLSLPAQATEPVLARLCLWLPPERMAGFEAAYQEQLTPLLKKHGLVESPERGRATMGSVFSRLFAVGSAAKIAAAGKGLQQDSLWQEALRSTGVGQWHWGVYAMPAGPGRTVEAGSGFRQGLWQSFGSQDGLPASAPILGIFQDRAGNLWFSVSEFGVSRYDGARFTTFTSADGLASNEVRKVAEDREGNLWIATWDGVSRYDGVHFTTFTAADGLAGTHATAVLKDRDGQLWFAFADGGVSRYDGTRFVTYGRAEGLADTNVVSLLQDRLGNMWFGTWSGGVSRYDGTRFRTFTAEDGLADNRVSSIFQDQAGNLWFGHGHEYETSGKGVSRYDGQRFANLIPEDVRTAGGITAILQDRQGDMWFSRRLGGVSRYDGQHFITTTVEDGLVNNQVFSMLEDRDGYLWIGSYSGVSRYDGARFTLFTVKNGLVNNGVMGLLEDRRGMLWVGTWGGVSRYDGKGMVTIITDQNVWSMIEDQQGNLWFAGWPGVRRYDGKGFTHFTQQDGLAPENVDSVVEDRQGQLWFGGGGDKGGSLSRYDGKRFTTMDTDAHLPADSWVDAILEDHKGELWFGTQEGLRHYDGHQFTSFTQEDGLANNGVRSLLEDRRGMLWVGTWGGGVSRYDGKEFVNFTTAEGLAGNSVMSMLEDRDGHLWFGTFGSGLSQYDGLVFQSLSRKDGLPNDAVQEILQDRKGEIWIGTEGGLVRYRPSRTPPAIRLVNVSADRRYGPVAQLQLSALQDYLLFEFQGASLATPPERMAYVYRLVGYEEEWRPCYANRVEYADLPLGEYAFEVKAVDQDLNYSETPATVKVTVHLPYGQFALYSLLGVLGLAVVWQAGRLVQRNQKLREANAAMSSANKELFSVNRQLEQTLEEKEKAQELLVRSESMAAIGTLVAGVAHELNNPLGAAYSLVQTVQEMVEEDTAEQLEQEKDEIVGHLAFSRKELNRAKEIVAALLGLSRQNQDYTEAVEINTVVQDALRVLHNQYKKYEVNIAEEYEEGLPAVQGNFAQLGQVCMNLIKNAIEALQGGEGQIALRTYREGEQVVFECADAGPGIPEEVRQNIFKPFFTTKAPGEGTGLGLYICHQTVEKHHGSIEVESEVGKGTRFRVKLPMSST